MAEFRSYALAGYSFDELLASVKLEDVAKGRRGTVIVKGDAAVPLVRSTTAYRAAARRFDRIHELLAQDIQRIAELPCELDNALVEHYTNAYSTMKRHSDQALDLAAGSSIAIYSCYRDPRAPVRRLVVKAKNADTSFELPLAHGTVVAFSLETNRHFTHTIALTANAPHNDWLGLTFRTAKTFVTFVDGKPQLANGAQLTLADEDQRRAFFQMRRRENDEIEFTYPSLSYTLSESDMLAPS